MDHVQLLRSLKGAPASILLALLVSPDGLTRAELRTATGYSDRSLADGLALLETIGLTAGRGDGVGLSPLFLAFVTSSPALHGAEDEGDHTAAAAQGCDPVDGRWGAVDNSAFPVDNFGPMSQILRHASAAAATDTLTASTGHDDQAAAASRASSGEICDLLAAAGIGRSSPAMVRILGMGYDVQHVSAHVRAWRRDAADGRARGVGLLIRRLLDGDDPPMAAVCTCGRCEDCRRRALELYAAFIER